MRDELKTIDLNGIPVPVRWSSSRRLGPRPEQKGSRGVVMCMFDDGEHGVEEMHFRFDPPVRASELPNVTLRRIADVEFTRKLQDIAADRIAAEHGYPFEFDDQTWGEVRSQARVAARGERHYKITDEFLQDVVRWYGKGGKSGMGRVIEETDGPSERTVRRWLAEARERGLR